MEELKKESDSIIVVPNERLLSIVEKNLGMRDSFRLVDNVLAQAVSGISNVILSHGANDINLDFADVKTVMSHRGLALMGVGESQGTVQRTTQLRRRLSPLYWTTSRLMELWGY